MSLIMDTIEISRSSTQYEADILNNEQIEQLLQEAETRLRQKAGLEVAKIESRKQITIPKLQHGMNPSPYIKEKNGVATADSKILATTVSSNHADELRSVEGKQKSKTLNDETDAGSQWFNLPKTTITPQLKRDLQIIEMRSILDPHRHYKKSARKGKIPTFSQVGTVIEGPTEFYSSRINKKDRSKNFVEEAMRAEADSGRFKRKYGEIQETKTSGKKGHYKKLMQKRKKS